MSNFSLTPKFVSTLQSLATAAKSRQREFGFPNDPVINEIQKISSNNISWLCEFDALHSFIAQTAKFDQDSVILPQEVQTFNKIKLQEHDDDDEEAESMRKIPSTGAMEYSQNEKLQSSIDINAIQIETKNYDSLIDSLASKTRTAESRLSRLTRIRDQLSNQLESIKSQQITYKMKIDRQRRRNISADNEIEQNNQKLTKNIQQVQKTIKENQMNPNKQINYSSIIDVNQKINSFMKSSNNEYIDSEEYLTEFSSVGEILLLAFHAELETRARLEGENSRLKKLKSQPIIENNQENDSQLIVKLRLQVAAQQRKLETLRSSDQLKLSLQSLVNNQLTPITIKNQSIKISSLTLQLKQLNLLTDKMKQQEKINKIMTAIFQSHWINQRQFFEIIQNFEQFLQKQNNDDNKNNNIENSEEIELQSIMATKQQQRLKRIHSMIQLISNDHSDNNNNSAHINNQYNDNNEIILDSTIESAWKNYNNKIQSQKLEINSQKMKSQKFNQTLGKQLHKLFHLTNKSNSSLSSSPPSQSLELSRESQSLTFVDLLGSKLNNLLSLSIQSQTFNQTKLMSDNQLIHDFLLQPQRIAIVHRALQSRLHASNK